LPWGNLGSNRVWLFEALDFVGKVDIDRLSIDVQTTKGERDFKHLC